MPDIAFIRNDPGTTVFAVEVRNRVSRASGGVRFTFDDDDPLPGVYADNEGRSFRNSDFNHWQCIWAAETALKSWETVAGRLASWQGDRAGLTLEPFRGSGLNGGYDRSKLFFLRGEGEQGQVYAGSSVDIVSHEVGHAILDALRPDLLSTMHAEVNALHEAFGDILALYSSLQDLVVRRRVLEEPVGLGPGNFLERIGEDLFAARELDPRRAANTRQLAAANSLRELTEVMTGCWYDFLIRRFDVHKGNDADAAALRTASREALGLFARAMRAAGEVPSFMAEVGGQMSAAASDASTRGDVRSAFAGHGITIQETEVVMELAGRPPRFDALGRPRIDGDVREAVSEELAIPRGRMRARVNEGGVIEVNSMRAVRLGRLARGLRGVTASARQWGELRDEDGTAVWVPRSACRNTACDDVRAYVRMLLEEGRIRGVSSSSARSASELPTHTVDRRGRAQLRRIRFACFDH